MTYTIIHTLKSIAFITFLLFSFFLFTTSETNAYFTTNQEAVALKNHTGLFLIEYNFGMKKHEVYMPIFAENTTTTSNTRVSYQIIDDTGAVVTTGTSIGMVLSSTPLSSKEPQYVTPKGVAKKFMLAVLFTPNQSQLNAKYRLQVTHLPFNFDGTQQLQLNPSELQYYTTKLLSL